MARFQMLLAGNSGGTCRIAEACAAPPDIVSAQTTSRRSNVTDFMCSLCDSAGRYYAIIISERQRIHSRDLKFSTQRLRQPRLHPRIAQHLAVDDKLGHAPGQRVDDTLQPGRRHVVEAFIGPAQRMWRDDDVV